MGGRDLKWARKTSINEVVALGNDEKPSIGVSPTTTD